MRLVEDDAVVLSSAFGEGFPNVIGEAMASALPTVVTDVGDAAELVGPAGLVVPPRAPNALAEAMLTIAGESPDERTRGGETARRRIACDFSLDQAVARYRALWECVASPADCDDEAWRRAGSW